MIRNPLQVFILLLVIFFQSSNVFASWIWTPETNKWINPKYAVKDTPMDQLEYALEFYNAGLYEDSIKELKKLIKHYPKARQAPEAQFYIAESHLSLEKPFVAFKAYQQVIDLYPFSDLSTKIVKKQFGIGVQALEGINEEKGFLRTVVGTTKDVADIFRQVIKNAPYSDLAPEAQYKIGLYLMEKKEYQSARDEFEKTMNDYPDSDLAGLAKYQIAVVDAERSTGAAYDQKVTEAAIAEFKEIAEENPGAELSENAKKRILELREKESENNYIIAKFYEKQKNYQSAKIYYRIVVDEYPNSKFSKKALTRMQTLAKFE